MSTSSHFTTVLCAALSLLLPGGLLAQTPVETSGPPSSRLDQVETTYQENLKKLHAPVLQEYLRQLETLRQRLAARGRVSEAIQVDAEIAKVKKFATSTGVLPYTPLVPPMPPADERAEFEPPGGPGSGRRHGPPALVLNSSESINPAADIQSQSEELPLGTIEWKVPSLPAGTYDVHMLYSAESLSASQDITILLGGRQIMGSLPKERVTSGVRDFRPFNLGKIVIDKDLIGETLLIQAASVATPQVFVRRVFLTKS